MGATFHSLQFRDATPADAAAATQAFVDELARRRPGFDEPDLRRFGVGPAANGWTPVFPGELYDATQLEALADAAPQARALYLWTADSDTWGAVAVADGVVAAGYDSEALGTTTPAAVAAALGAEGADPPPPDGGLAEEAMELFARSAGIATAMNSLRLIERGHATGLDPADVELHGATQPAAGPPADAIAYAWLRTLPPGLGQRIAHLIDHLRDEFAGGAEPALRATTRDGGEPPGDPLRAADAGELRALTASFPGFDLNLSSPAPDYHTLQVRLPEPQPRPLLLELLGPGLGAYYAFLAFVPSDPRSQEVRELGSWPPKGHYADYLSPALTEQCGGTERLRAALPDHDIETTPDGGLLTTLPLPPHEATSDRARSLRAAFASALEECAA